MGEFEKAGVDPGEPGVAVGRGQGGGAGAFFNEAASAGGDYTREGVVAYAGGGDEVALVCRKRPACNRRAMDQRMPQRHGKRVFREDGH